MDQKYWTWVMIRSNSVGPSASAVYSEPRVSSLTESHILFLPPAAHQDLSRMCLWARQVIRWPLKASSTKGWIDQAQQPVFFFFFLLPHERHGTSVSCSGLQVIMVLVWNDVQLPLLVLWLQSLGPKDKKPQKDTYFTVCCLSQVRCKLFLLYVVFLFGSFITNSKYYLN